MKSSKIASVLIILFCISFALARSFFKDALPRTHDMEFHAARVANYYLALQQGQFPPRWAPNLHANFGYPVFLFMYPYPYIVSTFFYAVLGSVQLGINTFIIISIVLAVTGSFTLAYSQTKKIFPSVTATLLYTVAPYSLVNMFVRGAIGEIGFWGLLPWTFFIFTQKNASFIIKSLKIVLLAALLLSHQLSAMIALPLLVGYLLVYRKLSSNVVPILIGLLLVQFFFVPFLFEKQFTQIDTNSTVIDYQYHFLSFRDLIYSPWGYGGFDLEKETDGFTKMVGIPHLFLFITGSFFLLKKKKNQHTLPAVFFIAVCVVSLLLMLRWSNFIWQLVSPLHYLQFPWRLLWVSVFSIFCLSCILFKQRVLPQLVYFLLVSSIWVYSLISLIIWAKPIAYFSDPNYYWLEYTKTATAYNELLPRNFDTHKNLKLEEAVVVRAHGNKTFPSYFSEQPQNDGVVTITQWTGTQMQYDIETTASADVIQKTAYFPGWKATVNGNETKIEEYDTEFPGRIVIPVAAGKSTLLVRFTEDTPARFWGTIVSLLGIALYLGWILPYATIQKGVQLFTKYKRRK